LALTKDYDRSVNHIDSRALSGPNAFKLASQLYREANMAHDSSSPEGIYIAWGRFRVAIMGRSALWAAIIMSGAVIAVTALAAGGHVLHLW
jgi:hypothetical protein